jgi:tRNA A-37 threonylcarbamoyl transferase component Bud32
MPVNLYRLIDPPEPAAVVSGRVTVADFAGRPRFTLPDAPQPVATEGGWIVTHPRYRAFLDRVGVTTGEAGYTLPGEVVSGHADRHAVRVVLRAGSAAKVCYLKREHTAGRLARLRHRVAGLGSVSRAAREAMTLQALEELRLPGPQWLAHGEDSAGRAFVLVEGLSRAVELRTLVSDTATSPTMRRAVAGAIAVSLADLHAAGVSTPDLAAKHVYADPGDGTVTLLDWQGARVGAVPTARAVAACLANLHATTPAVSGFTRLRVLAAYRRAMAARGVELPRLRDLAEEVVRLAARRQRKSSVRDQGLPTESQRLVWLAGEQVCATPEVAATWPTPAVTAPFYADDAATLAEEGVTLPGGRAATLTRCRTRDTAGRVVAALRERPWRSPGATAGRVLFHLARHGIPAPQLLAFGQRLSGRVTADSFVLTDAPAGRAPVTTRRHAAACGTLLARLHAAGVALAAVVPPHFEMWNGSPRVASPLAVTLVKRPTDRRRVSDLRALFAGDLSGLGVGGRAAVVRAYLGNRWTDRNDRRRFLRSVW